MNTSQLMVCLLCVSAIPMADALAGGNKHGKPGNAFGFPSVPQAPKFIEASFNPPRIAAPALNASALGNGAGVAAPAVGRGAASISVPAGQAIGNSAGMPAHAGGVAYGSRNGKDLDDRHLHGKAPKKIAAPTGDTDVQAAPGQTSTFPGEIAATTAEQASQLAAQGDPRRLPSCR